MRDAQGHELSGATTEAVGYFDSAVRAFALIYGDASGLYDAALIAAPKLVMAYLGKAWPLVLANDPLMAASARAVLNTACDLPMNDRECTHLAALSHAVKGHRASAVAILDRHLMTHPFDLVAHMAALQMDGHLGRFPWARDRSARALPRWSKAQELRHHAVILRLRIGGGRRVCARGGYRSRRRRARAAECRACLLPLIICASTGSNRKRPQAAPFPLPPNPAGVPCARHEHGASFALERLRNLPRQQ